MARRPVSIHVESGVKLKRHALPAVEVATFRAGEPIPFAPYLRMIVPGDMEPAVAASCEAEARRHGFVKVVREQSAVVVAQIAAKAPANAVQRSLRQVVVERAQRVTDADQTALLAALDEVLTQAGI